MIEKIVSILNQGEHEMMRDIDSFNNMMPSQGKIAHKWEKVRVKGHVEVVKEKLMELKGTLQ